MDGRYLIAAILLSIGSLAAACASGSTERAAPATGTSQGPDGPSAFALTSPVFADGSRVPVEHATATAGGRNTSVPLEWTSAPEGTRSFAVEVIDTHPAAREWVHWIVVDIPADTKGLSAGASGTAMPSGAIELNNTFGTRGWGGPQPPAGTGPHEYRFTVLALDTDSLGLAPDTSLDRFRSATEGHTLASASLVGTFGR